MFHVQKEFLESGTPAAAAAIQSGVSPLRRGGGGGGRQTICAHSVIRYNIVLRSSIPAMGIQILTCFY